MWASLFGAFGCCRSPHAFLLPLPRVRLIVRQSKAAAAGFSSRWIGLAARRSAARGFFTHALSELPPQVLLEVAREVQQDALLASASGGLLSASRLTEALRKAQRQVAGGDAGETIPGLQPAGRFLGGPQKATLAEVWGCMLFIFQGKLKRMHPQQLANLLDLLADAGPPALRFAHCSLIPSQPPAAPVAAAAAAPAAPAGALMQQQGESCSAAGCATRLPEGAPLPSAAPAAADACSISEHAVAGGPRLRPSLLQEIEELLLSQADEASLEVLISAVNAPQLLLQPFNLLPLSPSDPSDTLGTNSTSSSSTSSSSGTGVRGRFVQLLQPLLEPLNTLASPSAAAASAAAPAAAAAAAPAAAAAAASAAAPAAASAAASAAAAAAKASAWRRLGSALGCLKAGEEDGAPRLIALWHASLSLDVHAPALAAAALQVSDEVFPLLPLQSMLLLLRCCCMHLTRSSITYKGFTPLQQQQPLGGGGLGEGPSGGQAEAEGLACMQTAPAAACTLLLKAAERLSATGAAPPGASGPRSLRPSSLLREEAAAAAAAAASTASAAAAVSVVQAARTYTTSQLLLPLLHALLPSLLLLLLLLQPGEPVDRLLGISLLRRARVYLQLSSLVEEQQQRTSSCLSRSPL
ncbi:hypothetical protein Emag_006663 [Eimeria magna]